MSSIMKLFERVIEQRLRSYLEDRGFISKYQSGFRQNKSTDDHLFRVSQSVMERFNRGEHVVAAFFDVEKAFYNLWHNGLRYKILLLDLPTKMTCWLSDFLVGRVIQVCVNSFLSNKISVKSSKLLTFFSVAEAYGLIYPRPSGENFSFVVGAFITNCYELEKQVFSYICLLNHRIPKKIYQK